MSTQTKSKSKSQKSNGASARVVPSRNGGMMERQFPNHTITNYIGVPSVEKAAAKVEKLGGKVCMGKTAVPQMGYFVLCNDTENNQFALWEPDEGAK